MTPTARSYPPSAALGLTRAGHHPILARALAARGITNPIDIKGPAEQRLKELIHHQFLKGTAEAARYLADCIAAKRRLLVVADYDCDGATACAVAVRGLKAFGADVEFMVPNRMKHGYGLTPSVVDVAMARERPPEVLITVDNGVASHQGVDAARACGLEVLVTDHHLPSPSKPLPAAVVVVDPAQKDCPFPSKSLAGCGVIWYVLWALQDELRTRKMPIAPGFLISSLLPLVAMGTVADVVTLDRNNRILVEEGLARIRRNEAFVGIDALANAGAHSMCDPRKLTTSDIAFGLGPRINAAGRMDTMDIGIECLITDDEKFAQGKANELDSLNGERRKTEYKIIAVAVEQALAQVRHDDWTIVAFQHDWHHGVIGIVAGRLKELHYRPTFVLALHDETGEIKGSGRSIPGFNLKDALDQVDKACPGLLVKFGGHAMAAGVTLRAGGVEEFRAAFEAQARLMLTPEILCQKLETDGELTSLELTPALAKALRDIPWGQGFLEPSFTADFEVQSAKITGDYKDQLNLVVTIDGKTFKATRFRHGDAPLPSGTVRLVFKMQLTHDKFGKDVVKLLVDHIF